MKQRPILFSTEMVRAILAGRKTQTRRVVQPQPDEDGLARHLVNRAWEDTSGNQYKCPYGKPGDVLWVRETCLWVMLDDAHDLLEGSRDRNQWVYKTDVGEDWIEYAKEKYGYKWKPSIRMPKDAARIWLRITNVRVERLQDITEQDAIAEGIQRTDAVNEWYFKAGVYNTDSQLIAFERLWQSINGSGSWNANTWVWVVEFERIEKP